MAPANLKGLESVRPTNPDRGSPWAAFLGADPGVSPFCVGIAARVDLTIWRRAAVLRPKASDGLPIFRRTSAVRNAFPVSARDFLAAEVLVI